MRLCRFLHERRLVFQYLPPRCPVSLHSAERTPSGSSCARALPLFDTQINLLPSEWKVLEVPAGPQTPKGYPLQARAPLTDCPVLLKEGPRWTWGQREATCALLEAWPASGRYVLTLPHDLLCHFKAEYGATTAMKQTKMMPQCSLCAHRAASAGWRGNRAIPPASSRCSLRNPQFPAAFFPPHPLSAPPHATWSPVFFAVRSVSVGTYLQNFFSFAYSSPALVLRSGCACNGTVDFFESLSYTMAEMAVGRCG